MLVLDIAMLEEGEQSYSRESYKLALLWEILKDFLVHFQSGGVHSRG